MFRSTMLKAAGGVGMAGTAFVAAIALRTPDEARFSPESFSGDLIVARGAGPDPRDNPGLATSPARKFAITGSVVDLYPGARKTLTVRFDNTQPLDIRVVSTTVTVQSASKPGCSLSAIQPTNYEPAAGTGVVVPRRGSATIELPIAMAATAEHACEGATFSLSYSGTAVMA